MIVPTYARSVGRGLGGVLMSLGLIAAVVIAAPSSGMAPLDNNPDDEETYRARTDLDPGRIQTEEDDDGQGFDTLEFGIRGGGALFAWTELDGDERESELVVSDPTLSADDVRLADADGDGDPESVWVGTGGGDIDGDGDVISEEAGSIVATIDVDGDGTTEVIVEDTSRVLGEYHADSFGINSADDPREVLWVGILGEGGRGRAATVIGFGDVNDDGESEVELQDKRTADSPPFDQFIDIDGDGDGDIVIRVSDA